MLNRSLPLGVPSPRKAALGRPALRAAALLLALALVPVPRAARAEGHLAPLELREDQVWAYGEFLLGQGEYFRAISEYKRLLYYFPLGPHAPAAQERIGQAYLLGQQPQQAIDHFTLLLREAPADPQRDSWLYWRGLAHLNLHADRPYPEREATLAAGMQDLRAISPGWPGGAQVAGFLQALAQPPDLPHKSPLLAGTLSAVLPGSGSLYVGRYAEGALTFFVNALLIAGTTTAFQQHQPSLGTVLGALALAFYGGGIYAAANGAHKFNDRAQAAYLEEQRRHFGLVLEPGTVAGSFELRF